MRKLIIYMLFLFGLLTLTNGLIGLIQSVLPFLEQGTIGTPAGKFNFTWKEFISIKKEWSEVYFFIFLLSSIFLLKYWWNMKLYREKLDKGQHGTSEFEKVNELKKQYKIIPAKEQQYEGEGGVIISGLSEPTKPYRLLIDEGPVHTMVIGITRSGKGETFVFPMIDVLSRAKKKPSIVINDPKGELAAASYNTLKKRGYEVHVFNLIQQHMGMGFNPLSIIVEAWKMGDVSQAQQYANSVAYSLYNDPGVKDPFWNNSAKSLVTAIILAIVEDTLKMGSENKVTMYTVANFLATKGSDNDEKSGANALDLFFKEREEDNPARRMYATSNFSTGDTRSGIFSTAMDKLQIFTLEPNAKLTSYNSLKLTDVGFGEKPIVVFMVTPDFDSSNHILSSIFVNQLYRMNAEKATLSSGGKMRRHVHFLLDEFGNMPTVEGMGSMVTVGAGRGFRFHLVIQSYSQLKSAYGDEAETIIGNCSNQIYILTKDKSTAEQYSSLIGSQTITDISRSGQLYSFEKSHNESVKERSLLMPDELMRLKEGESVIVRANKRQDNKGRKIVPKPIYNKGATAHKFRWEYLQKDFDNTRSFLDLPIVSKNYHQIKLKELNLFSKSEKNQYLTLSMLLTDKENREIKKIMNLAQKEFSEQQQLIIANITDWSFIRLMRLIQVADLPLTSLRSIFSVATKYIPSEVVSEWEEIFKEKEREKINRMKTTSQTIKTEKDNIREQLLNP